MMFDIYYLIFGDNAKTPIFTCLLFLPPAIRRMTEGYIFSLSTFRGGGPRSWSQIGGRGVPVSDFWGGGGSQSQIFGGGPGLRFLGGAPVSDFQEGSWSQIFWGGSWSQIFRGGTWSQIFGGYPVSDFRGGGGLPGLSKGKNFLTPDLA